MCDQLVVLTRLPLLVPRALAPLHRRVALVRLHRGLRGCLHYLLHHRVGRVVQVVAAHRQHEVVVGRL